MGMPPPFTVGLLILIGLATWVVYRWRARGTERPTSAPMRTIASSAGLAAVGVLVLAQAVPYGRAHSNPPVIAEPEWANAETRELMVRACWGCHSNEVEWPWYSNVAPISWAVTRHVDEGRDQVNYQEWDSNQRHADETLEVIKDGSMPPAYYTVFGLHSDANLTSAELQTLIEGVTATPGLTE